VAENNFVNALIPFIGIRKRLTLKPWQKHLELLPGHVILKTNIYYDL
jgi:hypothetical protein